MSFENENFRRDNLGSKRNLTEIASSVEDPIAIIQNERLGIKSSRLVVVIDSLKGSK